MAEIPTRQLVTGFVAGWVIVFLVTFVICLAAGVDTGLAVIVAGAGGAAHLPGMLAAKTLVPVLGVPVASRHLAGQDSLLSIVQMPAGVPTATFAIGEAGATNAALFAVSILAATDADLLGALADYRAGRRRHAAESVLPPE